MIRKRDLPTLEALYARYGRDPWTHADARDVGIVFHQGSLAAMRNRGLVETISSVDGTTQRRTHNYTTRGTRPPNRWVITERAAQKLGGTL